MSDANRVDEILRGWLEARERNEAPDPEELIRDHPDLAEALSRRFRALSLLGPSPEAPSLRPVADNRYADFRVTGEGGMGIVYWALDCDLNRQVAFKIVRPDLGGRGETPSVPIGLAPPGEDAPASAAFETLKARFLQEAWVTAGLEHPGIVPVYELGATAEGVPYYTMRFVRGSLTLGGAIEAAKGEDVGSRLSLLDPFLKVCDTIRYAHAHGVIHRDLKPDNIAIGEFGEVVVLDWGLAKMRDREDRAAETWQDRLQEYRQASDLRTMASALGTPGYMSPEAALGATDRVDEQSDVYSLGAILFEILTGRLPFTFESYGELLQKLRGEDAPSATDLDPRVPEGLSRIAVRALAREPGDRYAGAVDLARAIRAWQRESALESEVRELTAAAKAAWAATERLTGASLLEQLDRVTSACGRVTQRDPGNRIADRLLRRGTAQRERAIRERERTSRRRVLARGGAAVLVVLVVAAVGTVAYVNDKRREAEEARARTAEVLDRTRALALVSASREAMNEDHTLALLLAREAARSALLPEVRTQLYAAHLAVRERAVFGLDSNVRSIRFSPGNDRRVTAHEDGTARVGDLAGGAEAVLSGHTDAVNLAVWAAGSDRIATASADKTARLFDASGKLVAVLKGHRAAVFLAVPSAAGDRVVTAAEDGTVRVWDDSGRQIATALEVRQAFEVRVSGAGDRFMVWTAGEPIRLFDFEGRAVAVLVKESGSRAWFDLDGHRILVDGKWDDRRELRVLDRDGKRLAALPAEIHYPTVFLSSDGKRVALLGHPTASSEWEGLRQFVEVFDTKGGKLSRFEVPARCNSVAIHPDGHRVLAGTQAGTAHLFDLAGKELAVLRGHEDSIGHVEFSSDGEFLLTASSDRTVRLWGPGGEPRALLRGHRAAIRMAEFHPDGKSVTTLSADGTARLWDVRAPGFPVLRGHARGVTHAEFSPAGDRILTASNDDTARIWTADGSAVAVLRHEAPELSRSRILGFKAIGYEPAGDRILTVPHEGLTRLWDPDGKEVTALPHPAHTTSVHAAFWLPDGRFLIAYQWNPDAEGPRLEGPFVYLHDRDGGEVTPDGWGGTIFQWATASPAGDRVLTDRDRQEGGALVAHPDLRDLSGKVHATLSGHESWLYGARFSPDGRRIVTFSDDRTARIWDLEGDQQGVLRGHEGGIRKALFSPDGNLVLTGSEDRTARLWDRDGGAIAVMHHEDKVDTVLFSPAGGRILTASWGRTARLWDRRGREIAVLRGHVDSIVGANYSPTGDRVVTASLDGTARVWPATDEALLRLTETRRSRDFTAEELKRYEALLAPVPDGP